MIQRYRPDDISRHTASSVVAGMSVVYEARELRLDRPLTLEFLSTKSERDPLNGLDPGRLDGENRASCFLDGACLMFVPQYSTGRLVNIADTSDSPDTKYHK
jgi:hypothetical protein